MTPVNLTSAIVVGGLYATGTYLLLQRSLMRILIGLVLLGHGTNLLLLLVGGESGLPPMVGSAAPEEMSDPLPQGMALTSIVITFALTTFLLALAYRAWTLLGDDEVRDDVEDARISKLERRAVERAAAEGQGGQGERIRPDEETDESDEDIEEEEDIKEDIEEEKEDRGGDDSRGGTTGGGPAGSGSGRKNGDIQRDIRNNQDADGEPGGERGAADDTAGGRKGGAAGGGDPGGQDLSVTAVALRDGQGELVGPAVQDRLVADPEVGR